LPVHRADVRQALSLRASQRMAGTLVRLYPSAGIAGWPAPTAPATPI